MSGMRGVYRAGPDADPALIAKLNDVLVTGAIRTTGSVPGSDSPYGTPADPAAVACLDVSVTVAGMFSASVDRWSVRRPRITASAESQRLSVGRGHALPPP